MVVWREKKTNNLIYITASTGIGGGILIDGKLLQGQTDTAGEIGHYVSRYQWSYMPLWAKGVF